MIDYAKALEDIECYTGFGEIYDREIEFRDGITGPRLLAYYGDDIVVTLYTDTVWILAEHDGLLNTFRATMDYGYLERALTDVLKRAIEDIHIHTS